MLQKTLAVPCLRLNGNIFLQFLRDLSKLSKKPGKARRFSPRLGGGTCFSFAFITLELTKFIFMVYPNEGL